MTKGDDGKSNWDLDATRPVKATVIFTDGFTIGYVASQVFVTPTGVVSWSAVWFDPMLSHHPNHASDGTLVFDAERNIWSVKEASGRIVEFSQIEPGSTDADNWIEIENERTALDKSYASPEGEREFLRQMTPELR